MIVALMILFPLFALLLWCMKELIDVAKIEDSIAHNDEVVAIVKAYLDSHGIAPDPDLVGEIHGQC